MSVKKSIAALRVPGRSGERRKYQGVSTFPPFLLPKGIRHSGCRSHSQGRFMEDARIHTRTPAWRNLWATIDQMSARTGTWWFWNQAARKKPDPSGSGNACRKTCVAPMRPTFSTTSFTLFTKTAGSGSYTASRSTCAARTGRRGGESHPSPFPSIPLPRYTITLGMYPVGNPRAGRRTRPDGGSDDGVHPEGCRESFLRSDAAGHRVVFTVRPGEDRDVVPEFLLQDAPRLPKVLPDARPVLLPVFVSRLLEKVTPRDDGGAGVPEGVGHLVPVKTVAMGGDLHQAASVRLPDLLPRHQGGEVLRRGVDEGGDDRQGRLHPLLPQDRQHLLGKAPVPVVERQDRDPAG